MILLILIVVLVVAFALLVGSGRRNASSKGENASAVFSDRHSVESIPAQFQGVWSKPSRENLWDSLEYFAKLVELRGERVEDSYLYLDMQTETDAEKNKKRGTFVIRLLGLEDWKEQYHDQVPYLREIQYDPSCGFRGLDENSNALNMDGGRICELIRDKAPHASLISAGKYPDGIVAITIHCAKH